MCKPPKSKLRHSTVIELSLITDEGAFKGASTFLFHFSILYSMTTYKNPLSRFLSGHLIPLRNLLPGPKTRTQLNIPCHERRFWPRSPTMACCPSSISGEAFTHGEKNTSNHRKRRRRAGRQRVPAVQEFLDFFFLSLRFSFLT